MASWSVRRKRGILLLILGVFIVLVALPASLLFYRAPTCFDGKHNGDEAGVDCGGSCELLCPSGALSLLPRGDARVLEVSSGLYEVVAVFENPNVAARVDRAGFTVKLYEKAGLIPVRTIDGETFVPPATKTFAVFLGPFEEEAAPDRAVFTWDELIWTRDTEPRPNLSISDVSLSGADSEPRVTASLTNNSLSAVEDVELIALVYDNRGNVVAATKTLADFLEAGEMAPVVFSWPSAWDFGEVNIDIIWRILPDRSYIR